jgi:hypothetical protein
LRAKSRASFDPDFAIDTRAPTPVALALHPGYCAAFGAISVVAIASPAREQVQLGGAIAALQK